MTFVAVFGAVVWVMAALTCWVLWRLLKALDILNRASSDLQRGLESSTREAMNEWNRLDEQIDRAAGRSP